MGDIASSTLSTLGDVASAGVSEVGDAASALVVNPLKSMGSFIKSSFTPSVKLSDVFPSVKSSEVFPSSRLSSNLARTSDMPYDEQLLPEQTLVNMVLEVPPDWQPPNVTGVYPSWHPSSDPRITGQSPYLSPNGSASMSSQSAMYPMQSSASASAFPSAATPDRSQQAQSLADPMYSSCTSSRLNRRSIIKMPDNSFQLSTATIPQEIRGVDLSSVVAKQQAFQASRASQASQASLPSRLASRLPSSSLNIGSSAGIPEYEVDPNPNQYVAAAAPLQQPNDPYAAPPQDIPEYDQPLAASYFIQPPTFVDDPFPDLNTLGQYDLSYLEGLREKLAKSIRSVTGQINLHEGRLARLTPEQLGVLQ